MRARFGDKRILCTQSDSAKTINVLSIYGVCSLILLGRAMNREQSKLNRTGAASPLHSKAMCPSWLQMLQRFAGKTHNGEHTQHNRAVMKQGGGGERERERDRDRERVRERGRIPSKSIFSRTM